LTEADAPITQMRVGLKRDERGARGLCESGWVTWWPNLVGSDVCEERTTTETPVAPDGRDARPTGEGVWANENTGLRLDPSVRSCERRLLLRAVRERPLRRKQAMETVLVAMRK